MDNPRMDTKSGSCPPKFVLLGHQAPSTPPREDDLAQNANRGAFVRTGETGTMAGAPNRYPRNRRR
jgi:hypothetical protein